MQSDILIILPSARARIRRSLFLNFIKLFLHVFRQFSSTHGITLELSSKFKAHTCYFLVTLDIILQLNSVQAAIDRFRWRWWWTVRVTFIIYWHAFSFDLIFLQRSGDLEKRWGEIFICVFISFMIIYLIRWLFNLCCRIHKLRYSRLTTWRQNTTFWDFFWLQTSNTWILFCTLCC